MGECGVVLSLEMREEELGSSLPLVYCYCAHVFNWDCEYKRL